MVVDRLKGTEEWSVDFFFKEEKGIKSGRGFKILEFSYFLTLQCNE